MPYKIYIPDAAFAVGGPFYQQATNRVTIIVGEVSDNPQVMYKTGGPQFVDPGKHGLAFGAKDVAETVLDDNMWSRLSSTIKAEIACLVAKGVLTVNDGAADLDPDEVLA